MSIQPVLIYHAHYCSIYYVLNECMFFSYSFNKSSPYEESVSIEEHGEEDEYDSVTRQDFTRYSTRRAFEQKV